MANICIIHYESCIFKQYYVPGKFSHISPQRIHSCHKWDNCCIWAKGLVVEAAIPSDWVLQKVEHRLLQIQVPYLLAALYAKYALILSFPSQNCALFLVLRGLFTFSSSMHPYRVSGITKPISWPININNMGKNFRISNVVAFEYPTNLGEEFTYLESCNIWIS